MNSMPDFVQSALSALRHLQPTDRVTAIAILNLWAHVADIDVERVVDYYFTGGRPETDTTPDITITTEVLRILAIVGTRGATVAQISERGGNWPRATVIAQIEAAVARLADQGRLLAAGRTAGGTSLWALTDEHTPDASTPTGRLLDETAARWNRQHQKWRGDVLGCPDWCTADHTVDEVEDGLILHQGNDHADGTVRKLLDAHRLTVRVSRTDCPSEERTGTPALLVHLDVELTSWEQAAELARTILDGFGYLDGAR